jgi:AraC family transcriptional regulator
MDSVASPKGTNGAKQHPFGRKMSAIDGVYNPDRSAPSHCHRVASLCLVLKGSHSVMFRKTNYLAEPGSVVFLPPQEPHLCVFPSETTIFQIHLEPSWIDQLRSQLSTVDRPSYHGVGDLTCLATRAYDEFRMNDTFSSLALEGLIIEMLAGIGRYNARESVKTTDRPPRWLRDVSDLLHEQFGEPLSIDEIAQSVGIHPAHLGRTFRRYHGRTIGEYLRDLRLQSACRMLSASVETLGDIALSCGYSDQSNFTTAFKRHTGLTPMEYRKIFRVS